MNQPNHIFCWSELISRDLHHSLRFYETLFRWQHLAQPSRMGSACYLLECAGEPVAAAYSFSPEMKEFRPSSQWIHYISTPSLELTLSAVETAGGKTLLPPTRVRMAGRFAVIADPGGARINLWEAGAETGYGHLPQGALGTPAWYELACNDLQATKKFYQESFGWKAKKRKLKNLDYWVLYSGTVPIAGLVQSLASMIHLPDEWLYFLYTKNLDRSLEEAKILRGFLRQGPILMEGGGRFAILSDPAGAIFALMEGNPALD